MKFPDPLLPVVTQETVDANGGVISNRDPGEPDADRFLRMQPILFEQARSNGRLIAKDSRDFRTFMLGVLFGLRWLEIQAERDRAASGRPA